MRKLIMTGIHDIISNSTSTELFNWLTGPLPTVTARYLRLDMWLNGRVNLKGRPVIQFGNNGIDWSDTPKEPYGPSKPRLVAALQAAALHGFRRHWRAPASATRLTAPLVLDATYQNTDGWHNYDSWDDLTNLTSTTYRRYFRLGVGALNESGAITSGAQAQLAYLIRPVVGRTLQLPPRKVWTKGSTVDKVFVATSDVLSADIIGELRCTMEATASTGDIKFDPAWRESDDPEDVSAWSTPTAFGNTQTGDGLSYGTGFTSASPTKRHVQLGALVYNDTGSAIEAARLQQIFDLRRTT